VTLKYIKNSSRTSLTEFYKGKATQFEK